jgi:hypothetical protein
MALYNSAQRAFPDAEVFVAATNDTSTRPFPFAVKEKLAKLAGVEAGHFVQVKSPFRAEEITSRFNPDQDVLIFVRSEKDAGSPPQPGGVKKDGSPSYLQPLLGARKLEPFAKHAYMAYLPTVEFGPGMTSATQIRTAWPTLDQRRKTALVMSLYPKTQGNAKLAATVVKLLDAAIGSVSDVAEGIEDNYNKNDAGVKAALQSGVKLIPIQPNNDATGKPIYIHDYSGRYTVIVDMGGISVPFYVSTGSGGKATVAVDKWYPFFGIGSDGWINKGSEANINDFYGSNKLKRVAQALDNTLGLPSRAKNVTGWSVNRGDENYFISIVNRGLDPAARSDRSTKLRDNMLSVLRKLGEPNKYVEKEAPVQAARPKAYAFDKNNPEHVAAFDATSQSEREIAMALAKDPKNQGVAEGSLEDRLKKYVRPVVKTTPKIERTTNPAGRTTDHVEWKVTGPMGDVTRFSSKKAAQAHYDSFGKPDTGSLNEFAPGDGDDEENPLDDYPCYDCGSTIYMHHTRLCDLAEPDAVRDLPAQPGTQHWTGRVPKGLTPIPGLGKSVEETVSANGTIANTSGAGAGMTASYQRRDNQPVDEDYLSERRL